MSNTKHTPTPWRASNNTGPKMQSYSQSSCIAGTGANSLQLVAGCFNDIGGPEVAAGNAAFIVRACNSHEQLVAALRNLIAASDAYSTVHAPDSDDAARMVRYAEAFNNARAALAAAEA